MAIFLIKREYVLTNPNGQTVLLDKYLMDSDDDKSSLPDGCSPGSEAVVADETAHRYIVNPSGDWKTFGWSDSE